MTFADLYRLLRRYTVVSLVLVLLGAAAGVAWHLVRPTQYVASTSGIISIPSDATVQDINLAEITAKSRVKSYVAFATGSAVLDAVAANHGLSPSELSSRVEVEQPPDTALIVYHVTDPSARTAQQLADDLAEELSRVIEDQQTGPVQNRLHLEVVPQSRSTAVATPWVADLGLGIFVGLVVALLVAAWRRWRDERRQGSPVARHSH